MNAEASPLPPSGRLASIDAYRGFVMLLMLAEVLRLCQVAAALPESVFWRWLCYHQSHVEWVGCSLHDLIQPGFSFLVGAALPFSIFRRRAQGDSFRQLAGHAGLRSVLLIIGGTVIMALYSEWRLNWHLEDTLSQIGLAYPFVFLLALRPARAQWMAVVILLAGWWLWFACSPLPGPDFDYGRVGVSAEWLKEHGLWGFGAHWQKNSNPACLFDLWWMNLFPRATPYTGPPNGVNCLNFVPLIATMLLGVRGGAVLQGRGHGFKALGWLASAGAIGMLAGWALGAAGLCPVVKRLWTPSWVLFSGGACFLFLAAFHLMVDIWSWSKAAWPLVVIGMNSLVAYSLAHLFPIMAFNSFRRIFGTKTFRVFGGAYEPVVYGVVVLSAYWVFLYLLYRRKLFIRV